MAIVDFPAVDDELIRELAQLARELAVRAGDVARSGRQAGFTVTSKSTDTDLVTEVDRAVEAWLADELMRRRPGDGLLGEEGAAHGGASGVRWIVDPIDGTVNFALGLPQYGVSVAAEVQGEVVAGCVHNPETRQTYWAELGGGSFVSDSEGERRLGRHREVPLARAVIGTGFGYDSARRERQAAVLVGLLPRIADIRRLGAASLDLCAVAEGRLDGYFEVGLNPWDWAAGLLVATEAGCRSSGLRGRPVGPHFAAVAGPALASDLFTILEELDADIL